MPEESGHDPVTEYDCSWFLGILPKTRSFILISITSPACEKSRLKTMIQNQIIYTGTMGNSFKTWSRFIRFDVWNIRGTCVKFPALIPLSLSPPSVRPFPSLSLFSIAILIALVNIYSIANAGELLLLLTQFDPFPLNRKTGSPACIGLSV